MSYSVQSTEVTRPSSESDEIPVKPEISKDLTLSVGDEVNTYIVFNVERI